MVSNLSARLDAQGCVLEHHPALAEILGHDGKGIIGQPLPTLLSAVDRHQWNAAWTDLQNGFRGRLLLQQAGQDWSLCLVPLPGASGQALAWFEAVNRDLQADAILRRIMTLGGEDFFTDLARELANSFGVRHVIICEALDEGAKRVRTVAFLRDGQEVPSLEFATAGTPCGIALQDGFYFCPRDVKKSFPEDLDLKALEADCYVGFAIPRADGGVYGQICLLHDQPIERLSTTRLVLELCASRLASEFQRLQVHQQRRHLLERLQDHAANVPGWMFTLHCNGDGHWAFLFSNPGAETLFGERIAKRIHDDPRCYLDFIHPDDRTSYRQEFLQRRAPDQSYQLDYRVRHQDGDYRWVRALGRIREQGRDLYIHGLVFDLQAQKALEKQRDELTQHLSHLVEAIPDAILLKDGEGRLLFTNRAAHDLLQLGDLDWHHRTYAELASMIPIHEDRFLDGAKRDLNAWQRGSQLTYTEQVPAPGSGGIETYVVTKIPLFQDDGERLGLVTILHDVTEKLEADRQRRALEARVHRASKLETVGRMAEAVAHKFENLLTAVLGYGDLLVPLSDEVQNPDQMRSALGKIHEAAERASRLARDLLSFGPRPNGVGEVITVDALFGELTSVLKAMCGPDIQLTLDLEQGDSALTIRREDLADCLLHLVTNARDALSAGGEILLRGRRLTRCTERGAPNHPGDWYRLDVVDQGVGMDPQLLERIYDPYFTTHDGGRRQGLGLALVQSHLFRCGGTVAIESHLGQGTRVRLWIPISAPSAPIAQDDRPAQILLVEDEEALLDLAQRTLNAAGYQVHGARTLAEARALFDHLATDLDLLITDLLLPDGHGTTLVAEFRRTRPSLSTLLISGYPPGSLAEKGIQVPRDTELLAKPYRPTRLLAEVSSLLRRPQASVSPVSPRESGL